MRASVRPTWDKDDLITFLGQKVKVQCHTIAAEAHSTRRYRRVQLFLVVRWHLGFMPMIMILLVTEYQRSFSVHQVWTVRCDDTWMILVFPTAESVV